MRQEAALVFVVDDDPSIRDALESLLRSVRLGVQTFSSAQEFLASPRPDMPSCLVLDVQMPGLSGLDLQQELNGANVEIPTIFITGHGDVPMSVRAMKHGALEFLVKPWNDHDLIAAVQQGIARDRSAWQRRHDVPRHEHKDIVGASAGLKRVLQQVDIVAPTDSTVLVQGETGTGKELIARAIHNSSRRANHPFVKINCAAIPSGLLESELFGHEKGAFTDAVAQKLGRFELAHGGTLFLDEVGDIPMELQPKLLRVLQEKEFERLGGTHTRRVDVRIVAASHRDLWQMATTKAFREDLFFRLNVFPIRLPPLRDRADDIPLLVRNFVEKYSRRMNKPIETIPEELLEKLCRHSWPGNIRELQNVIERAMILSSGTRLNLSPAELATKGEKVTVSLGTLEEAERQHILKVLDKTKWVIGGRQGAASQLGLKRTTLLSKMERLGISRQ